MELMHSSKLSGGDAGASTQKYVDIEEIKDGVVILKDGTLRAVAMVSAINFDLKSTEEQDAIIMQYQNFLNSLDFSVQILISSRRINLEPYLEYLDKQEKQISNELLGFQISEYKKFIKSLIEISNVMTKFFYVVVPFHTVENLKKGFFENLFSAGKGPSRKEEMFDLHKNQLIQRLDQISAGLSGIGLKVEPLKTEDLIELFYNSYNPVIDHNAIIKNIDKIELK